MSRHVSTLPLTVEEYAAEQYAVDLEAYADRLERVILWAARIAVAAAVIAGVVALVLR